MIIIMDDTKNNTPVNSLTPPNKFYMVTQSNKFIAMNRATAIKYSKFITTLAADPMAGSNLENAITMPECVTYDALKLYAIYYEGVENKIYNDFILYEDNKGDIIPINNDRVKEVIPPNTADLIFNIINMNYQEDMSKISVKYRVELLQKIAPIANTITYLDCLSSCKIAKKTNNLHNVLLYFTQCYLNRMSIMDLNKITQMQDFQKYKKKSNVICNNTLEIID